MGPRRRKLVPGRPRSFPVKIDFFHVDVNQGPAPDRDSCAGRSGGDGDVGVVPVRRSPPRPFTSATERADFIAKEVRNNLVDYLQREMALRGLHPVTLEEWKRT